MNSLLDDPWDPDSLIIAPLTVSESHIAGSTASWLSAPWRVDTETREIVGPSRQRIQVRIDDRTGEWLVHLTCKVQADAQPDQSFGLSISATLRPSQIAAAIRLRLLPEYELAIARAFESEPSVKAAELRLMASRADRAAALLGAGWRRYQGDSGIASVGSAYFRDTDTPTGIHGSFAFNTAVCDLFLSVDWDLAEHLAGAIADYFARKESGPDER